MYDRPAGTTRHERTLIIGRIKWYVFEALEYVGFSALFGDRSNIFSRRRARSGGGSGLQAAFPMPEDVRSG
jgi:hypothetical protein